MFADVSEYMANSKVYSKYLEDGYLPADARDNITFRDDLDGVYLMQLGIPAVDHSTEVHTRGRVRRRHVHPKEHRRCA